MVERVKVERAGKRVGNPRFVPGHKLTVGNKGNNAQSRYNKRMITQTYIDVLSEKDKKTRTTRLYRIARSMAREAENGNVSAAVHLCERIEGRPTQAVEISGSQGKPLRMVHSAMTAEEAARAYQETIALTDDSD